MRSKRIPGWAQVLGTAAAALAFLLVYELAVYRVPLQQIFLPCSYWSDEVIYNTIGSKCNAAVPSPG